MARVAPATKDMKPMVTKPKLGRRVATAAKAPAKPVKAAAAAKPVAAAKTKLAVVTTSVATRRQAAPMPTPAPKLSKDELRAQVEKLERANATLRTKSRETNKAAKAAAKRIAELEERVVRLEKAAAVKPTPASPGFKPKTVAVIPGKRQARAIDPGDAVPSGVTVEDPAPMDAQAEAALESPERNLKADG